MDVSIRRAIPEDYEGLCEIFADVDALHRESLPHVFRESDGPPRTREFVSAILADQNAALFVAEHEGQIIGVVHVSIQASPDIPIVVPRRYAVIVDLVVAKRSRRFGIGRSLVERAQQWAVDRQATGIELTVWEFNEEAIAFYERLGYTTARRRMWKSFR
jgi:ribosomal protein S18 acetylase RimI-like enzyme